MQVGIIAHDNIWLRLFCASHHFCRDLSLVCLAFHQHIVAKFTPVDTPIRICVYLHEQAFYLLILIFFSTGFKNGAKSFNKLQEKGQLKTKQH
jgi:hypothetical protein